MRALPPETAVQLSALTARLAKVDQVDRAGWQAAAREASFVFARWSLQTEGTRPGPLAAASDSLARSAQPDKDWRGPNPEPGLLGRTMTMMARAASPNSAAGWFAVMRQLDRITQAVQNAHTARGELVAASRLGTRTGLDLVPLRHELVAAARTAAPTASQEDRAGGTAQPTFSVYEFRDEADSSRAITKAEALETVDRLPADTRLSADGRGELNDVQRWIGRDVDVDRAIAQKFPHLLVGEQERAGVEAAIGQQAVHEARQGFPDSAAGGAARTPPARPGAAKTPGPGRAGGTRRDRSREDHEV
jgi:hypothetical protein